MREYSDIEYSKKGGCRLLDMYLPEDKNFPTLVFFHGGGFKNCDKADTAYRWLGKHFSSHGIGFVSANYSMYPNAKFPDFIEDGAEAVAFVKKNIRAYGGNDTIIVGGSSAGGHLSMMLCYDTRYLKNAGVDPSDISAYIHDAGQPTTHFSVLNEYGIQRYTCVVGEKAPLFYVGKEKEYPPQLFFVAENDIRCRYEETQLLLATLDALDYDMKKVKLERMMGYTHTGYLSEKDQYGNSIFERKVNAFLSEMNVI